jgi:hypothetical protein
MCFEEREPEVLSRFKEPPSAGMYKEKFCGGGKERRVI